MWGGVGRGAVGGLMRGCGEWRGGVGRRSRPMPYTTPTQEDIASLKASRAQIMSLYMYRKTKIKGLNLTG